MNFFAEVTYHPEQEKAQQISRSDTGTCRKVIRYVVIAVSKDTAHEDRCDPPAVVRLCRKVYDSNNGTNKNIQARPSNTCCGSHVDREAKVVLDRTTAVEYNQDSKDSRPYDSSDHTMPPQ